MFGLKKRVKELETKVANQQIIIDRMNKTLSGIQLKMRNSGVFQTSLEQNKDWLEDGHKTQHIDDTLTTVFAVPIDQWGIGNQNSESGVPFELSKQKK